MARYCAGIGWRVANIGQWRHIMYVCTYVRDSDGKPALVHQCCQYWLVNGNTLKESCAAHALIGIPTIAKHRIPGISDEGQHRESGTSGIGNNRKWLESRWWADDGLRRWSTDDRWIPIVLDVATTINFWLGTHGNVLLFPCSLTQYLQHI